MLSPQNFVKNLEEKVGNNHARRILEAFDSGVFAVFASEMQRSMADCFTKGKKSVSGFTHKNLLLFYNEINGNAR